MTGQQADQAARWALVCSVLDAVLDAPENERQRVLDERCQGDPGLREEVAALLQADTALDDKLETPLLERAGALFNGDDGPAAPADPPPGETIGPWRLIEELGRGGMGAVWLAERADGAFEHRVALKLLKRGLDSDAILERFLAERQILARLQHPHIAHLIDGGVAADGRPYFAMERVEGEPITRWCDARRLPVRERLELFLAVADAVQYAHRQLVVHRDLKPSNILVTQQGETKLLDFGIAKLLDADADRAEAQTLTQLGIRMLTPEYAAPEQLRGDAITTATDVYALGVLLYKLLSGQRPPPAEADPAAGKLPPRPSTKVTDAAAEARGTTRERLRRALRGDLDTIVLRAMHPAPERRYGSAEAFGADIRRHLDRQPVEARPDSFRYRAGKFVARNRLAVAAAALVALTLVAGIVATTWQAREARQQARRAEQVKDFLVTVFEAGGPQEWRGKEPTARDLLDAGVKRVDEELPGDPALHAEMLAVIGSLYLDFGQYERAERMMQRSLDERRKLFGEGHEIYADSLNEWSALLRAKGDWNAAEKAAAQAVRIFRHRLGEHPQTAQALGNLSAAAWSLGNVDEGIRLRRQALDMHRHALGEVNVDVANDLRELGSLLVERGDYAQAEPLIDKALAIDRELYGDQSTRYAAGTSMRARVLYKQGKTEQAARAHLRAAEIYRRSGDTPRYEDALNHYGIALCRLGHYDDAETALRQSATLIKGSQDEKSQWFGIRLISLGECQIEAGKLIDAERSLRQGLTIVEKSAGAEHPWTAYARNALARSLGVRGRIDMAMPLIERAYAQFERLYGADDASTAESLSVLGTLQFAAGNRRDGLAAAKRAWQSLQREHGENHPMTAISALNLAGLELRSGQARVAEARLGRAVAAFDMVGDQPRKLTARMLQGMALLRLGRFPEAEAPLRAVLTERRKMYGDDNYKTAEAEIYLGACLARLGRREEGAPLLAHGRSTLVRQLGMDHDIVDLADEALASAQ